MPGKNTHLQVIPQQRTQNTAVLPLQTCEKNQWPFILYDTARTSTLASEKNFANLGSFAKVFIPVGFIITWYTRIMQVELS